VRARTGVLVLLGLAAVVGWAQTDVIGVHDLSPSGTSGVAGTTLSGSCLYCHAPHSGTEGKGGVSGTPLWNQKLSSVQQYTVYSSPTMAPNVANQSPPLGSDSTLCLSCHDGTVAPGTLTAYGSMNTQPLTPIGNPQNPADLSTVHPFSLVLPIKQDQTNSLQPALLQSPPTTADPTGAVKLIKGNVECTSCHNPHVQNIDANTSNFLVENNSSGALCQACHQTNETADPMKMVARQTGARIASTSTPLINGGALNPLAGWNTSIHATAANRVPPLIAVERGSLVRASSRALTSSLGSYGSVGRNGCASCHSTHEGRSGKSLLIASDDQTCLTCHNGGSNVSPAAPNILAELTAPKISHALAVGNTPHAVNEPALLNENRHAACVDCHNPHSSRQVPAFPPAPAIRASQGYVVGISATDGTTEINPAVNQYENCLRCHGASTGKQRNDQYGYTPTRVVSAADPLNIIPQFGASAVSSHPVFHDRSSTLPQPSLRSSMLNLDGRTQGRPMGTRILCTDCHNSDDNREFGGKGPNGPHGSIFPHLLERRYEFSQAPGPGNLITNLFPNPSLSAEGGAAGGPYALCGKCHDLNLIVSNTSFSEHARHINDGFSCSVCHTAHGTESRTAGISGERLVNFDAQIVAPNGTAPITYDRAKNSCNLMCHGHAHGVSGSSSIR
jgi:predicted CXXCH cytochrome family protein